MNKHSITFTFEKTTKNTTKFAEKHAAGSPPVVGVLYAQSWAIGTTSRTLVFAKEKETKGTFKYEEVPAAGSPTVVGSLYVQKWAAGDTATLTATLTFSADGKTATLEIAPAK